MSSNNATLRQEALKFLIHFIGDAHQPLHNEERREEGITVEVKRNRCELLLPTTNKMKEGEKRSTRNEQPNKEGAINSKSRFRFKALVS